jgi:hypothetical protein
MAKQSAKPTTPPPPPKPDPLADALIQNGFAHNAALLDINGSLQVCGGIELPYPWNLPSRPFQFPIEVTRQEPNGNRRMGLLHPLLSEHPFVRHVEASLDIKIDPNGADRTQIGPWWHAVDLVSHGLWHDLLKTAQFTTPNYIASAVTYGLMYSGHHGKKRAGHISTADAREIMAFLESSEPADWRGVIRSHFSEPSLVKQDRGSESWPINHDVQDRNAVAWGMVLAIERGWFAHVRAGFLGWTEKGREQFAAIDASAIAPRPTVGARQLDLF